MRHADSGAVGESEREKRASSHGEVTICLSSPFESRESKPGAAIDQPQAPQRHASKQRKRIAVPWYGPCQPFEWQLTSSPQAPNKRFLPWANQVHKTRGAIGIQLLPPGNIGILPPRGFEQQPHATTVKLLRSAVWMAERWRPYTFRGL